MKKLNLFLVALMVTVLSAFAHQYFTGVNLIERIATATELRISDEEGMTNEEAAEAFMQEYESLQQQFTQVYNTTVNAEEYQEEKYAAVIEEMSPILNGIQQNLAEKQVWAEESMEKGTLAAELEEILASFEDIQIQLTQYMTTFNGKVACTEAIESFQSEYESLSKQFTQVYNVTVGAQEYSTEMYAEVIDEMTPVINAIQQNMAQLNTWAEEAYEGGSLVEELDEILASFEGIQIQLTQFLNTFNDAIAEIEAAQISVSLMANDSTEYALNSHSVVTIDEPISAIKVAGLDQIREDVTFAIYDKRLTIAEGTLSVNTIGYAEFPAVVLHEGVKYNVVVSTASKTLFDEVVIGAAEESEAQVNTTIMSIYDTLAVNTHSNISAEAIQSIEVAFDGIVPAQAAYSVNKLALVEGDSASTWEICETLAEGEFSLSGKAYAELAKTLKLYQGNKYLLVVNYMTPNHVNDYVEYEINGAAEIPEVEVSLIADEETEYTLNTHSVVTIDQPISAIKVQGLGQIMEPVYYAIYDKRIALAQGELSVNNTGYAEFAPVSLHEGVQYNVIVSTSDINLFDQMVIGAAEAPEAEVATTIMSIADTITLNNHSNVSAEAIQSIEVAFDGVVPAQAAYSVTKMIEVVGDSSTTWEMGETLAEGEFGLNGKAYAELAKTLKLYQGNKYLLVVNYMTPNHVNDYVEYEINGAAEIPEVEVTLIADEETEYALNSHSIVTVDEPISAIKVQGLEQIMEPVYYAIYDKRVAVAKGELSVKSYGYAEFAPVSLVEGVKYNVIISTSELNLFDQIVIGAAEEPAVEIAATINDSIALNNHSIISAEEIKSLVASFDGVVPTKAAYSISSMIEVVGDSTSTWEVDETIAQGELALSGKGYVEFENPILLNAGTKYLVTVNCMNANGVNNFAEFEINGSYIEYTELAVSLIANDSTEYALNSHSIVTIDEPISAIKVAGLDQVLEDVTFAIYDKRMTLAEGTLSVNTIGYAEFPAVNLYEGIQYNVVISAGEETLFDQIVIGAAEPVEPEIAATLISGNDTIALNTHSIVSAEMINAIEVAFDGVVPAQAGYSVSSMIEVAGDSASTWEVDETIAQGVLSLSGKGYAELEEPVVLNAGTKYLVIVNYMTANGVNNNVEFQVNGAYSVSEIAVSLLTSESDEYALNTHSIVTIDRPISAIKVAGLETMLDSVSYAIYDKRATLAEGLLSVNTIGYAEFPEISLYEGVQYNVVVYTPTETLFDQIVIGAAEEPVIEIAATINDSIALNSHSAISAESIKTIEASFDGIVPMQAGYSVNTMVEVAGDSATTWEIGETLAQGVLPLSGKGYIELDEEIVLNAGTKYSVIINYQAGSIFGEEVFEINGSAVEVAEPIIADVTELDGLTFVITDASAANSLAVSHTDHPAGEQDVFSTPLASYASDKYVYAKFAKVTDASVSGDNIYTIQLCNEEGANYSLWGENGYLNFQPTGQNIVFALGLKGQQYGQDAENCGLWEVTATEDGGYNVKNVGNGGYLNPAEAAPSADAVKVLFFKNVNVANEYAATGIFEIATSAKANAKYIENGKVVIVKNGVKYNVAGSIIK